MSKMNRDHEAARRNLANGYTLVAYVVPGKNRAQFRVVHANDDNLSLTVSAEDAVALCAMITSPM
jgi:hypothetical protein